MEMSPSSEAASRPENRELISVNSYIGLHSSVVSALHIVTCSTEGRRCLATVVECFHGYAHHSVLSRCMVTNSVGCIATDSGKANGGCYGNQQ
jgi:hypothetical protein